MAPDSPAPTADPLLAQTVGPARVLTINRPERRNALVPDLAGRVAEELAAAARDPDLRTVILRGAGGHFCVGLDLKWYLSLGEAPNRSLLERGLGAFQDTIRGIVTCPLPVVAVLEGSAAGFGLDLALACDLRIATETASLSSAFARMGLVPDGGSTYLLPRLIGMSQALSMLLGGETVDAARARAMGLVSIVVSPQGVEPAVTALTERLAAQSRDSLERIKALARRDDRLALDARLRLEADAQVDALLSQEFRQRLRAFLAKNRTA